MCDCTTRTTGQRDNLIDHFRFTYDPMKDCFYVYSDKRVYVMSDCTRTTTHNPNSTEDYR